MSSLANLQGFFKRRYGDFINPFPSDNTIAEYGKFVQQDRRSGENYNFPVRVQQEHGQTSNVDGTAFLLNSAIDSVTKNAQLDGATIMLVGNVPYSVLYKASNGAGNGNQGGAFETAMDYKVESLMMSGELYRELSLLYGPGASAALGNIGVVNTTAAGTLATNQTIRLTDASWISGLWSQMVGALVDVYQANGTSLRGTASAVTVIARQPFTGAGTGCRITLFKATDGSTVTASDLLIPTGWLNTSCSGLETILRNAGSLFGIDASIYAVWKPITVAVGGALTRAVLLGAMSKLYQNGLRTGGKLFVSGPTFASLAEEADALQRFIQTKEEGIVKQQGTENLLFKSPAGNVEVAVHTYMKQGEAMFISRDNLKRVGSTDLTFRADGLDDWFLFQLPLNAGYQMRIYSNQAPVLEMPYRCAFFSGIANATDETGA